MTPLFDIQLRNTSLFEKIQPFLLSLTITDEPGLKSDKLDLVLADNVPGANLDLPKIGDLLKISLGYKESGLFDMGTFSIDGYALSKNEMRITAHAADFLEDFKNPKSRSFENVSLENIIQTITSEHNIVARISSELSNIKFPAIHQTTESNLHFLTRLGQQFNVLIKPAGNFLVATPAGHGQAASGSQLPEIILTPDSTIHWSLQFSKKEQVPSVVAKGYDTDTAEEFFESVGDESETDLDFGYSLRGLYPTREAAKIAAKSVYEKLTQKAYTFTAEIPGDPNILAESRLRLQNFRSGIPTDWITSHCTHALSSTGYKTSLEAMLPAEFGREAEPLK
jgi:phage protein D